MERFCQQLPVPLQNASVVGKLVQLVDVILVRVRPKTHLVFKPFCVLHFAKLSGFDFGCFQSY